MGFFDLFKRKQDKPKVEENIEELIEIIAEETTDDFAVDIAEIENEPVEEIEEEIEEVEEIEEAKTEEEETEEDSEITITLENGEEIEVAEGEETEEFFEEITEIITEMSEKPSGDEEILVTTEDGDCYVSDSAQDEEALLDEILEVAEEMLAEPPMAEPPMAEPEVTEPVVEETAEEEPTVEEPIVEEPIAEERIVEEPIAEPVETETPAEKKQGFFMKLKAGLDKTRQSILGGVDAVLGAFNKIDEDLFEELEETLIMADMGVETTMQIVESLRKRVKRENVTDPSRIKGMLIDEITKILSDDSQEEENLPDPTVLLVIGVNGVGKTTTIGKLANRYKEEGRTVLLAAADTFRAAAIDQLEIWGERGGISVIKHEENSDPAAVVFDAVHAARNQNTSLLICDTAGRLHNKKNLMEELRKIAKVIQREHPNAHKEVYLVLDATTGQNALQQAKIFKEVADITGIVLTKLDGTAKGGIVVAIKNELKIPVRYIGVGEGIYDLQKFEPNDFAKALFGE